MNSPGKSSTFDQEGMETLLTVKDVATVLGVSLATVYRLTLGRKIPFLKVGGQLRFRRLSLDAWARQREKPILGK
jgi:excisionase family DNA binding protein